MALRSIKDYQEAVRTIKNSSPLGRNRSQEHKVLLFMLEKLEELENLVVDVLKNPITVTTGITRDQLMDELTYKKFAEPLKSQTDPDEKPKEESTESTELSDLSASEILKRMSGSV